MTTSELKPVRPPFLVSPQQARRLATLNRGWVWGIFPLTFCCLAALTFWLPATDSAAPPALTLAPFLSIVYVGAWKRSLVDLAIPLLAYLLCIGYVALVQLHGTDYTLGELAQLGAFNPDDRALLIWAFLMLLQLDWLIYRSRLYVGTNDGRGGALAYVGQAAFVMLVLSLAVPNFIGSRGEFFNFWQRNNAREIEVALERYATLHGGIYPRSAEEADQALFGPQSDLFPEGRKVKTPIGWIERRLVPLCDHLRQPPTADRSTDLGRGRLTHRPKDCSDFGALLYQGAPSGKSFTLHAIGARLEPAQWPCGSRIPKKRTLIAGVEAGNTRMPPK